MKAVLLAAGKGTRLSSLTQTTPKPLLEIAGKAILQHNVELCLKHGITEIFINTSYKAAKIKELLGSGKRLGARIKYSYEPVLLGTAGALNSFKQELLDEPFFVLYADNFTDFNLKEILGFHLLKRGIATIALCAKKDVRMSGVAVLDENNRVLRFIEKPDIRDGEVHLVNAGIYVLSSAIFTYIPSGFSDFGRDIFPALISSNENVFGIVMKGRLFAVDTLKLYNQAMRTSRAWK